jgi:hypothetical protein
LQITLAIVSWLMFRSYLPQCPRSNVYSAPHATPPFKQSFFSLSFSQGEREKLLLGWDVSRWLYRGELTKPRSGQSKQTPDSRAKIYLHKSRAKDWLTREQQRYQGKAHMSKGAIHFFPPIKSEQKAHPFLPLDAYNSQTI